MWRFLRAPLPRISCVQPFFPSPRASLLLLRRLSTPPSPQPQSPPPPPPPGAPQLPVEFEKIPLSEQEYRASKPPALVRPLGLSVAPYSPAAISAAEAAAIPKTWAEKHADFTDYSKHLERRSQLKQQFLKPYFRDVSRVGKRFRGKSWFAPSLLFRAEKSGWFPRLTGRTLEGAEQEVVKSALLGRVSIVTMFSSRWAENQVGTFLAGLELASGEGGRAQTVHINVEDNWVKAFIVRMFMPSIRRKLDKSNWSRYFLVQKGMTAEIREKMGYWNSKVGYVYLVDWNGRVRWAASGDAEDEEKESLKRGVEKLVRDHGKVVVARKAAEKEKTVR